MTEERWAEVDAYIANRLLAADAALDDALVANTTAGLPSIDVSPLQGKLLHLLARLSGAKRILEIGTLGGYSTIWLAKALPTDGIVVTLEIDPHHAEAARANFARAGVAERIDLRLGAALDTLQALHQAKATPFDLVFIDADKPNNPTYFEWALRLSRPGTVIVCDNVVRGGRVLEAASADATVQGTRRLFDLIGATPGVTATAIQTIGAKGWDGFAIAIVE